MFKTFNPVLMLLHRHNKAGHVMVMAGRWALSGAGNMKYIFYNIIVSGHELICGLMHVAEVGWGSGEIREARYVLMHFSVCYCFQRDGTTIL